MKKRYLFGTAVGVLSLWLAFRDVEWKEVVESIRHVQSSYFFLVIITLFVTHVFRARRWGIFVRPIRSMSLRELFAINSVGFLAIQIFPFRLGEFARPILLRRRYQIPISSGFAMVTIERVFDGLMATLALLIGLSSLPQGQEELPMLAVGIRALTIGSFAIFCPALGFLLLAVFQQERALWLMSKLMHFFPLSIRGRLAEVTQNFVTGLRSLPNAKSFLRIVVESLCVWGAVVASFWFAFQAFQLPLSWGAALCVLGISAIGVMIPGAPGAVGTYQLFVQAGLQLYGVSRSTGLAFSVAIYTLNFLYVVVMGLLFLPSMSTPVKEFFEEAQSQQRPS